MRFHAKLIMRRTRAPSQIAKKSTVATISGASRTTDKLLNILAYSTDENTSNSIVRSTSNVSESVESEKSEKIPEKRVFNVVWDKMNKRKRKTWAGDGILEYSEGVAELKDSDGHVIGRSTKLKDDLVHEGSRIFVGSLEVEIIDMVNKKNDNALKKICQEKEVCKDSKKVKMKRVTSLTVEKETDALIMPKPDLSHQWKYNENKLQINDVKLDSFLSKILRSHQKQGVVFLYACITGMRNIKYNGAILADEMGLGKTLQCISLIWLLLKNGPYGGIPLVQRVLIVTPSSLTNNWLKEFKRWLGFERLQPYVVNQKQKSTTFANMLASKSPVMIISYEMLVRHYEDIKDIKFQLLICDEGHRLKNNQIRISTLLAQMEIKRRIILTGTPLQNDLQEFYALIDFINPGALGDYYEYKKHFEEPIVQSNQPDCSDELRVLGEERAKELNHITSCFILRRTQSVIDQYLPLKQDCVIFCTPTSIQEELYKSAVQFWENSLDDPNRKIPHLSVITALKKLCNDPRLIRNSNQFDSAANIHEDMDFKTEYESLSDHLIPILEKYTDIKEYSGKMTTLEKFLDSLKPSEEKVVIISYFTQTLDLMEKLCVLKNYTFLRLDGNTPVSLRMGIVDKFNNTHSDSFIFLLSGKAGGIGLSLIGASRLVLFDLDWNPAADLQAMSRIWRDGQKRNVYIYRFLTAGTIEEKIYQRQISKTTLSNAVMDVQNSSDIRLSIEELKDLFTYKSKCLSLTHESLRCHCEGNGVSIEESDNAILKYEDRDCQLTLKNEQTKTTLKISELMEWEHYSPPIRKDILEELLLKCAEENISFIFRNRRVIDNH